MKKEPWRIVIASISVALIVLMWTKNNVLSIYDNLPAEQVIPLMATTFAVSMLKVAAITAVLMIIKWISRKFIRK